jgi:hypothetical protein
MKKKSLLLPQVSTFPFFFFITSPLPLPLIFPFFIVKKLLHYTDTLPTASPNGAYFLPLNFANLQDSMTYRNK